MRQPAIGIFDSGIGGLTVLRAIRRILPRESTIYLGDTARVPYGTKSPQVVTRYAVNTARFLTAQENLKLLVVACNTASAVALPALREMLQIPVMGVVEPGADVAVRLAHRRVGVIGTQGTIASGAYQRALAERNPSLEVVARPCPLFVPLAEEGWLHDEVAHQVAERYLGDLRQQEIEALVLGCTHYPLLSATIRRVLGPDVVLVDSAEAVAQRVVALLKERVIEAPASAVPQHTYYLTDDSPQFIEVGSRFLGAPIEGVERVDI